MNQFDAMMEWENGTLSNADTVKLFAGLIRNGMAWTLQGMYGRQAVRFIEAGLITREGKITEKGQSV